MSITLTIAIATGTAVLGFIFSRVLDIKHMRYQQEVYEEAMERMASRHKAKEARLLKALAELQMEKAKPMSMRKAVERLYNIPLMDEKADESVKVFFDLSQTLPEDNGIDFGGF